MHIKLTSSSFVAQSFIAVAACVAAPLFCASSASAQTYSIVTAWGLNSTGQCTIPAAAQSGVSAIAGGSYHTIALKDGAVLAWGSNREGQCAIPASANCGVSAIAGGGYHTIALYRDVPSYQAEIAALTAQNTALTARLNCGDLNGDGEVNGADLGKLLISWGQCQ